MIPFSNAARSKPPAARRWEMLAWIAGAFLVLVGAVMLIGHLDTPTLDPLKSPELKEMKSKLRENPADDSMKQKIRELDLQLRRQYFHLLSQTSAGAYLLIGGGVLFAFAAYRHETARQRLPMPQPKSDAAGAIHHRAVRSRWAVAAAGSLTAVFLFALAGAITSALPGSSAGVDKLLAPAAQGSASPDAATAEELQRNWPQFRGPGGNGLASGSNYLVNWDAKSGEGIAWKTPLLGKGFNSPVIWSNRVVYSGGDAAIREIFCHDLSTGQLLWRRAITNVPGSPAQPPEVPESTGYCAATMATDGRRLYAMFANGDLAAVGLDGKPVWSKGFGALKNPYGHATSLATWNDRLIVQLDQGEAEEGKSKLYLLDGRTGQVIWQKQRKVGSSWATPIVAEAAGKAQIITLAIPAVVSYGASDGAELWRVDLLNGEITPSPVFAGGQVIVASPSDKLVAIRPDGSGDVSKTHVAWTNEDNVPDITSPVSNGQLVFTVTTSGMLSCVDAKDGKKVWEHDYEFECHASPLIAAGRVYMIGQKGTAVVVEAGREFKQLGRSDMPDNFSASPAFAYDKIILRGSTNLWCIGKK